MYRAPIYKPYVGPYIIYGVYVAPYYMEPLYIGGPIYKAPIISGCPYLGILLYRRAKPSMNTSQSCHTRLQTRCQ